MRLASLQRWAMGRQRSRRAREADRGRPRSLSWDLERAVLIALYEATDGPNWVNSDNWLTDVPLRDWYGVDTDTSGRVVRLDLSGNDLSGPILADLSNLSSLEVLWLSGNNLTGPIPAELGKLASVTRMNLSTNALTGPIPAELGSLADLESLYLSYNDLTGPIPESFLELEALERFRFERNADLCAPGTIDFVAWLEGHGGYLWTILILQRVGCGRAQPAVRDLRGSGLDEFRRLA